MGLWWIMFEAMHMHFCDDVSSPIRFHASKEVARRYLGNRKKNPWPNEQFNEVDWEHLDLAMKSKPNMYKIWRSKLNSGFCRTRVQVGRYSGDSGAGQKMSQLRETGNGSSPSTLPKWGQNSIAYRQCGRTGKMAGEGRQHRPGISILVTVLSV